MTQRDEPSAGSARGISTRAAEVIVALLLASLGALVVFDSHRLGSSWGSDGPEAGYFPFYIGLIMCVSSVAIVAQVLFGRGSHKHHVFVEWQPLRQVLSVLIPAALFVLAIQLVGLYVAAAIYIAGFMRWLGKYGWGKSTILGVAVSVAAYITFEVWFQVPLYKGIFDPLQVFGY
jgi:hypothetical protein